jgi:hypothetical protein
MTFDYGALVVPLGRQSKPAEEVFDLLQKAQAELQVPVYTVQSGYHLKGIDLGSSYVRPLRAPKAAMLIGEGTRSYEAGEVWHLLDTRVHMPITKLPLRDFNRLDLSKYNTLVMVSGRYSLTEKQQEKVTDWVKKGNTLITIGGGSAYAVEKGWIKEALIEVEKDSTLIPERLPYVEAPERIGKEEVGGVILKTDLDLTHPLSFGYQRDQLPVYKNNEVWLKPSMNPYSTVARYTKNPHIDGYLSEANLKYFASNAASLMVSKLGQGRVVLFADNPNFRGSWYGTNRLFLNALFLGNHIRIPE